MKESKQKTKIVTIFFVIYICERKGGNITVGDFKICYIDDVKPLPNGDGFLYIFLLYIVVFIIYAYREHHNRSLQN